MRHNRKGIHKDMKATYRRKPLTTDIWYDKFRKISLTSYVVIQRVRGLKIFWFYALFQIWETYG